MAAEGSNIKDNPKEEKYYTASKFGV